LPMRYLGLPLGDLIRPLLFGIELLRKWNGGWLDGSRYIFVEGWWADSS